MKQLWNSFKIAFSMYSKIPMPKSDWKKENMRYIMCFFPLIGLVIGALTLAWGIGGGALVSSKLLYTIILVLIPVFVTGGIHLDGLLDTADALNSYQPRERKLEILKDSNSGAFAIITAMVYFLLRSYKKKSACDLSGICIIQGYGGIFHCSISHGKKHRTCSSFFRWSTEKMCEDHFRDLWRDRAAPDAGI